MTTGTAIRRGAGIPLALLLALLAQVVIVNRLPLPGGGVPDLVLLVVTATGATTGPMAGMLAGFAGGLALDIAPPGGHLAGEYALVFCLAGYGCGRLRELAGELGTGAPVTSLVVMAAGAAGGEAAKAAIGRMLSDPDMALPAVRHVLPGAILYDLLLSPFVLWVMAAVLGAFSAESAADPRERQALAGRRHAAPGLVMAGPAPRLRFGGDGPLTAPRPQRRAEPRLRLGSAPRTVSRPPRRAEPRLNLAAAGASAFSRTNLGGSSGSLPRSARRPVRVNFTSSGRGVAGAGTPGRDRPGGRQRQAVPGKGWLRAGKRGPDGAARRKSPGKGWLKPTRAPGLAKFPGSAMSARPAAPKFRRHAPARGWLKRGKPAAAPKFRSAGGGWLGPARPRKGSKRGKGSKWMGGSR
jgi:rod shape-determining protein MreD